MNGSATVQVWVAVRVWVQVEVFVGALLAVMVVGVRDVAVV